ncbi:ferric reductase like transmembrane component [Pyrenophora tritici-repentis]|nr:ferric reductase like transmembrane component [Pyrenophora tritici-repentis]KAI1579672.1 ferric reductase like transmembrane component [Pyrenophora tritici-repentis]PWO25240.1 Arp, Ankyrin repeat containing protein [Pyrenophora tritici-repentis]
MDLLRRHEGHLEVKADRYWAFGYSFETLSKEQQHQRREVLDRYGFAAQWSVLVIFALFQLGFAVAWVLKSGLTYDQPKSPSLTKRAGGKLGWLRRTKSASDNMLWWMRKDVIKSWRWGTRGEWVGATIWTVWLFYLCIADTGKDYMHLTKRFGQVGASQLPIHYLLAMRAPYSPVQYLTRLSHEQIKASHQILGRITFLLFLLHAVLYLNFFILTGFIAKRIKDWDVIWGLASILLFSTISTTALGFVRRRNYRIFYVSHIVIANLIIVPLYLHVAHIRVYVYEVMAVNFLHLVFRGLRLKMYRGTLRLLPGTTLVQIRVPLPTDSNALKWRPGQHVYLSRPWAGNKAPSWYDQWLMINKTNPFTVASLPSKDKELLLVARTLNGNTKYLGDLARYLAQGGSNVPMLSTAGGDIPILPLLLEGPYGASTRLPNLSEYDRVLLVAGGVGATFIIPMYRSMLELDNTTSAGTRIRCIWAVRNLAETQWATLPASVPNDEQSDNAGIEANGNGMLQSSPNVEVYVTRSPGSDSQVNSRASGVFAVDPDDEHGEAIEMQENEQLLSMEEQMEKPGKGMVVKSGRPNISKVVDEVLSKGMRTAVICCGPKRLTEDTKKNVEVWVKRGHDVFWYDETFGW